MRTLDCTVSLPIISLALVFVQRMICLLSIASVKLAEAEEKRRQDSKHKRAVERQAQHEEHMAKVREVSDAKREERRKAAKEKKAAEKEAAGKNDGKQVRSFFSSL